MKTVLAQAVVARRFPDAALAERTGREREEFLRLRGCYVRPECRGLDQAEREACRAIPPDRSGFGKAWARIFEVRATRFVSYQTGRSERVDDELPFAVVGLGESPREAWSDAAEDVIRSERMVFGKAVGE